MEEADLTCPYCWEKVPIAVSSEQVGQTWIEDCQICCRPMEVVCEEVDEEIILTTQPC
ncbi:MAG: CPXCG motif-containing cysteine-rich protein [Verrucomicrobiota bacterium]